MKQQMPGELQGFISRPWTAPHHQYMKGQDIRKVFPLNVERLTDRCSNCAGTQRIFAFFAVSGPHDHAASSTLISSKWIKDGWWYGGMRSYPCPVCAPDSTEHIDAHAPPPPVDEQPPLEYEDYTT